MREPGWDVENRESLQGTMTQTQDTQDTQNPQDARQAVEAENLAGLVAAAESLLFVSGRPLEYTELRKLLDVDDTRLTRVLETLADQLESQARGIRVQRLGSQVQLVTAPENARYIAALLGLPMTAKLTTAAMETLAVISYRQPMTRAQIEAVRGVNSDRALASLIQHGLVTEVGRAQTVGRPALFATTPDFLQQFGLTTLAELPHIEQAGTESQNGHHHEPEQLEQLTLEGQHGLDHESGQGTQNVATDAAPPEIPDLEATEE
jgi:segregation and condensation protein B